MAVESDSLAAVFARLDSLEPAEAKQTLEEAREQLAAREQWMDWGEVSLRLMDLPSVNDEWQDRIEMAREIREILRSLADTESLIARSQMLQGECFFRLQVQDSTLHYLRQAWDYFSQSEEAENAARCALGIGYHYSNARQYVLASTFYRHALTHVQEAQKPEPQLLSFLYNNLMVLYIRLGEYDKALEFAPKSLEISLNGEEKEPMQLVRNLTNAGVLYRRMGDYDRAELYLVQALEEYKRLGTPDFGTYNNLGALYLAKGEYDSAVTHLQFAIETVPQQSTASPPDGYLFAYQNLADAYLKQGQLSKLLDHEAGVVAGVGDHPLLRALDDLEVAGDPPLPVPLRAHLDPLTFLGQGHVQAGHLIGLLSARPFDRSTHEPNLRAAGAGRSDRAFAPSGSTQRPSAGTRRLDREDPEQDTRGMQRIAPAPRPRPRTARPGAAATLRLAGRLSLLAGLLLGISPLGASRGEAELLELRIEETSPFAGGRVFGEAGAYQRMVGVAIGEIDPEDPRHSEIALLDHAPRNARGRVGYEIDVFLLAPTGGSDLLLYDVTNRGSKVALGFFNEAPVGRHHDRNDPRSEADAGNGFLLERGYAILWSGWDPTVRGGGMTARLPRAMRAGQPLRGRVRDELSFGIFPETIPAVASLSHPPRHDAPASLSVRARERDVPRPLPRSAWRWEGDRGIALVDGQFEPGALYDFRYESEGPPVLGLGYAAVRDLVSFLRHAEEDSKGRANPLHGRDARHPGATLAVGVSQSGRFLRHFLELGMNRDARDRRVFDGVLPYIAGAGKVFANHAFGQPGLTAGQHMARLFPEHWYPFAWDAVEDPLTGGNRGLLRGEPTDPLVIEANTSTEYWHKGASLIHTDPLGRADRPLPPSARLFLISGTEHAGGMIIRDHACANRGNPHRPNPALRALLVALDEWVRDGKTPPASRIPQRSDGTLVTLEDFAFPKIPGVEVASRMNRIRVPGDWVDPPREEGPLYGALVPAVDADGNERAGLRLPPIAAPLATFTGWNVFAEGYPTPDLCGRSGTHVPFPERADPKDPRRPILERYPDHADYVARVDAAARALVEARLLLPADAEAYVRAARAHSSPWSPPGD